MNGRFVASLVAVLALAGCATTTTPASASLPPASAAVSPTPSTAASPVGISTAPTASTAPTVAPATPSPTPVPPFRLTSAVFAEGGSIPRAYTCDGTDVSPALAWTGVPDGTKALVLVVEDPDAGGFAHWLVLDMDPGRSKLGRGAGTPASSSLLQGINDFGRIGWNGPCPPSGEHRYRFTLYALVAPLGLDGDPGAGRVRSALAGAHVLGHAVLLGRYRRGG
jgi:Raf kinase inhibitor-like YbhB/YbcL family protein